jgi:hypothetical protein
MLKISQAARSFYHIQVHPKRAQCPRRTPRVAVLDRYAGPSRSRGNEMLIGTRRKISSTCNTSKPSLLQDVCTMQSLLPVLKKEGGVLIR